MQIDIACLCGQGSQTVTLAADSFPIQTSLDHSSDARYSTGMLFASYLPLACAPNGQKSLGKYSISEGIVCLFCEICGCHLFRHCVSTDEYMVASGVVQYHGDVIRVSEHNFTDQTLDGGPAWFMSGTGDSRAVTSAYTTSKKHKLISISNSELASLEHLKPEEKLRAQCHCGEVQFFVTPPNAQSAKLSSPWPDLLVPYHSASSQNLYDEKWWLKDGQTKYLAGLCACRSCRLSAGFPIQAWAFIPRANLVSDDDGPYNMDSNCLRRFESSPGVYRNSCRTCGATVFWHSDERLELIDVSVGLFRAATGVRADTWLDWDRSRVSFIEEALDQGFARALQVDPSGPS